MNSTNKSEMVREICIDMLQHNNPIYLGDLVRRCRDLVDGWNSVDLVKLRVRVLSSLNKKDGGFQVYKYNGRVLVTNSKLTNDESIECIEYSDS